MRVVVPAVPGMLHDRVLLPILRQGYEVTVGPCDDAGAYPRLLARQLLADEDVCIIEHDVETRPGFLADLDACPCPWGFFAYDLKQRYEDSCWGPDGSWGAIPDWFAPLGHTRFRAGVGQIIAPLLQSEEFLSHWLGRDVFITQELRRQGLRPHRHRGKALHWHRY